MTELLGLSPEEIQTLLTDLPAYRAIQVFRWLHRGVQSCDEMTDLPRSLRERLSTLGTLTVPQQVRAVTAPDGTTKTLLRFADGQTVESVFMRRHHGEALCLSTQAGCRMGCVFCASTTGGLGRNLTAAEMMAQVLFTGRILPPDSLVLMGTGEPLDNFDNTVRFLRLLSHPDGLGMSLRRVSLSTCGLPDGIKRLAALRLQLTLSVSLHAPDDKTRSRLLPVNRSVGVARLLEACADYFKSTGRRVSFEYTPFQDINDSPEQARLLGRLLRGMLPVHLNLIPYNPTERGQDLRPSPPGSMNAFGEIVSSFGPTVTVRRSAGGAIGAACGQLRGKTLQI